MANYFMEIEYTRDDGTKFRESGTHVITHVDGRWAAWRASDAIVTNARFIASTRYAKATLIGVQFPGDYSRTDSPLPDGRRNVVLSPMSVEERKAYRVEGYYHP